MTTLTLGGVVFQDFEVPESINSGGEQMLNVHKLVGGKRVIDVMGPDDADIHWQGRFRGSSAEERALLLDLFRRKGNQLLLTYSLHRYQVVIKEFSANFEQFYEIPYSISCTVLLDETQAIADAAIGYIDSLVSDALAAQGYVVSDSAVNTAVTGVVSAVTNYQAGVPSVTNALTGITAASEAPLINSIQANINSAKAVTQESIAVTTASISATPVFAGGTPAQMASALSGAANGFGQLGTLYQISGILGRMSKNTLGA